MRIGTHLFLQTTVLVLTGGAMMHVIAGQVFSALEARERVQDDGHDWESFERLAVQAEHFLRLGDLVLSGGDLDLAPVVEDYAESMTQLADDLSVTPIGAAHAATWESLVMGTGRMRSLMTQYLELPSEDRASARFRPLDELDVSVRLVRDGIETLDEGMGRQLRLRSLGAKAELAQAERLGLGAILAFFATILISSMYLRRVLERPIHALAMEAAAARAGERFVAPAGGPSEVQALSSGFAELVQGLEDARDGLEQTVDVRTAELKAALQARSQFLANTSHELRTPMNAILGFSRQLMDEQLSARERRESIHHIQDSGEQLMDLISDLLDITGIDTGQLQVEHKAFASGLVLESLRMGFVQMAEERGLQLEILASDELPLELVGDGKRVRQILRLLVDNAIKFTNSGTVQVELGWQAGTLWATVMDTGMGMAEEMHERIFDAFEQIDSSHTREFGGTGLGLALGRKLARSMQGNLTVKSALGKGSIFRLEVRANALDEELDLEQPSAALPSPKAGLRILVVDDVDLNRILVRRILEKMGQRVEVACDGADAIEAVAFAAAERRPFDAILMDLQMPGIDGYEATQRITEMGFAGSIIALSAAVMPEQQARAIESGCSEFLCKPIDLKLLRTAISRVGKTAA